MKIRPLILLALTCTCCMQQRNKQTANPLSGLDDQNFDKFWMVESESPYYKLSFRGDTCEIVAPKGLTLWYREELHADVVIEYEAAVLVESANDRLSDLNCFWMATDPQESSVFERSAQRGGVFANCAQMKLYYLGYGGNYNSTTRFRRYTGEPGPEIITEYTDTDHLLKPNHWYEIKLVCKDGKVQYWIDGECLVDFEDPEPYTDGWFGFRTTLSRTTITNFRYSAI